MEVSSNQEAVEVPQAQMVNENQGPSKVNSVLLLIGIDGAGKSTLLSSLQGGLTCIVVFHVKYPYRFGKGA